MKIEPLKNVITDVASPCVRNCCLDAEDICLGCNRHIDEIMAWRTLDNEEKAKVLQQCQKREQEREQ